MDNQFVVNNLLRQNEGERLEFKSHFSETVIARQIVAMLNAKGGDILVGINENKEIQGVSPHLDIDGIRMRLMTTIKPTAPINITEFDYSGKQVILISVWEGSQKPYTYGGKIYQRTADYTHEKEASKQDIEEMISKRSSAESNWEREPVWNIDMDNLDVEQLHATKQAYQQMLGIKDLDDEEFLMRCGLMQNGDLTNACVLLYAQNPIQYIPQANVRLSIFASDNPADLIDTKIFEGNLFRNVDAIFQYLDATYAKTLHIEGPVREERWNYPRIAVREGVMNALVHKNYSSPSSITNIRIFPSKLEILNTGSIPSSISFEQIENNSYSILRNPDIAHQCYYRGLIEMMGTGIARIKQDCKNNNFAIPEFKEGNGIISVIFSKLIHNVISTTNNDYASIVNQHFYTFSVDVKKKLVAVLHALQSQPGTRVSTLQKLIDIPDKTLERYIKVLKEAGLIEYRGAKKTGGYYITNGNISDSEGINEEINEEINEGINE